MISADEHGVHHGGLLPWKADELNLTLPRLIGDKFYGNLYKYSHGGTPTDNPISHPPRVS